MFIKNFDLRTYIVYKWVLNGKIYFGSTYQDLYSRAGINGIGYKGCTRFWEAICQIGFEKAKGEIIAWGLNEKQAKMLETYLIKKYHTTDPRYGYNCTCGDGFKINKDLMEKLLQTDDIEIVKSILEYVDDNPKKKNTHDVNYDFKEKCKAKKIQGKKNIRNEMKKDGIVESSMTHYLYESSGGDRFDSEYYELWTTPERDCEGDVKGLF